MAALPNYTQSTDLSSLDLIITSFFTQFHPGLDINQFWPWLTRHLLGQSRHLSELSPEETQALLDQLTALSLPALIARYHEHL